MFIDEWVGDGAYKQLPLGYHSHSNFCCGQFFWTHTQYAYENLELWRPAADPDEPTRTIATTFRITPAGKDAFRRSLPLGIPKLETNEEFIVVRAKRRPVMLVQPEAADMAVNNRGYRGKVQRKRSLIAPIFGLADAQTAAPEFNPAWVDRIRKMEFPQLVFLPKKPGFLEVDSLARLDELQSVFTPHLDPTQFALGDEMQKILVGQIQLFFANVGPNYYTELREMLLKS